MSRTNNSTPTPTPKSSKDENSKRIQVFIRVRPPFETELEDPNIFNSIELYEDSKSLSLLLPNKQMKRVFYFDHCFGPDSTQSSVYEIVVQPIVENFLNGINGTVLAYGQTGTGLFHKAFPFFCF